MEGVIVKKNRSRKPTRGNSLAALSVATALVAGCSGSTGEAIQSSTDQDAGIELLVRFAIDSADRYPPRVHNELALDGTMPFENGYVQPDLPSGPVEMDCSVVDEFGITFKYLWAERNTYPRKNIEMTLSHPELDTDSWRFERFTRPPTRATYRPRVYTWSFELEDRFRRNGTYTFDVTYGEETLLQTEFLMSGCETTS